ncbi:hypothetical protein GGX14DRAFT_370811 [Mycena pura]|uniref:Uncharacterized protein n=1 Tax=Mycena pura TaxID=153505 RepID=A0AAD6YC55_9AGAR|nr:hypothetical protein GGX14DRAFT_370811 [Mycena pura]
MSPALPPYSDSERDDDSDSDLDVESVAGWEPPPVNREYDGDDLEMGDEEEHGGNVEATHVAETRFLRKPFIKKYGREAGRQVAGAEESAAGYAEYQERLQELDGNDWGPFRSQMDWEVARWAKLRGSTSTALTELLQINGVADALGLSYRTSRELNHLIDESLPSGRPIFERHEVVVGGEAFDLFFRPILPCLRSLFGDPDFAKDLIFAPEKLYTDAESSDRMYYDIHTGKWWWGTQNGLDELKPGGTVVPVIISSDKTQTTTFRNKSCYPMYATIGNIPKEIRRKPSRQAYILIGYLPTTRLEHIKNKAARRRALANLYHACVRKILQPLEATGLEGLDWKTGLGDVHHCHPLFAIFGGDYPEQCLATGTKNGECPICPCPTHELGDLAAMYEPRDIGAVLGALAKSEGNVTEFTKACKAAGIKPLFKPFWENLPFCNIFMCVTPDILHQILQGVLKHVFNWVKEAYGPEEIDARCRRLPPNHNVRLFLKGVTSLSRISGTEHGQIARILLGLIVDLPLPGGQSPLRLVRAVRAILDFLYLSQYPVHTTATLHKLDDALKRFHENKSIFKDLGIREHFNFPKLHNISHQSMFIKLYGTADNYNTEYTERLHIDFAKDAYRASNRKDEYFQMTLWLERKEKILWHEKFVRWRRFGSPAPAPRHPRIQMTKSPSVYGIRLNTLAAKYGIRDFETAFAFYAISFNNPTYNSRQIATTAETFVLPFQTINAFHKVRFWIDDAFGREGAPQVLDVLHVKPGYTDRRGRNVGGRFDTALANLGNGGHIGVSGYCVARIRMVFTLTETATSAVFRNNRPPKHLAYVELFSNFSAQPEANHGMYKITRFANPIVRILPVDQLGRTVHLFPQFGRVAPRDWTSSGVLDDCPRFYVSPWSDRHAYITVN